MPRVRVDKEACIACGVCWSLAPDVFELDPNTGKTRIKQPYVKSDSEKESVGEVPEELRSSVEKAAESCPVKAISVE